MSPVRCGVIGVGYLGQHHARIYDQLPDVELVGLCDADEARAREIAERHQCDVYPSPAELAAQCDAVSIVVPTNLHAEVALQVLPHGCHLLIEKPLCENLVEAESIVAAAKEAGVIVQVGHIEHFNPVMTYLEEKVDHPRFITADRLAPFQPRGTEVGVVLDLMIHDIGIILELVKSPLERIDSVGVSVLSRTEDIANARLSFANGCVANINTSRVSQKKVREIRIFQPSTYLSLNFMEQKGHLLRKSGPALTKEDIPLDKGEPLALELASFVDCIRRKADPKVGAALGKSALEVALEITRQITEAADKLKAELEAAQATQPAIKSPWAQAGKS